MKSSKEKRALIAGMIGCLLYVIGDFLFAATGKTQSTESIGLMVKVAYLDMATWRMVVSIICGVLCLRRVLLLFDRAGQDAGAEDGGRFPRRCAGI